MIQTPTAIYDMGNSTPEPDCTSKSTAALLEPLYALGNEGVPTVQPLYEIADGH